MTHTEIIADLQKQLTELHQRVKKLELEKSEYITSKNFNEALEKSYIDAGRPLGGWQ